MSLAALVLLCLVAGLMAYIRFAPSDPVTWHRPLGPELPFAAPGVVLAQKGRATLVLPGGADQLAALDGLARATPRTRPLAGSVGEGRITWITRTAFWGFPDYTTAELRGGQVHVHARLRFGGGDHGVNAARLRDWVLALAGP